ncbi:hypothetical protein ACJRO7_014764 [Eucalyptus globulus]|uniref:Uncharacterized protein n=1 Tax=Eucalyptus globulus TaxID=34317 RepID=A0ABD3L2A7_EUCGL
MPSVVKNRSHGYDLAITRRRQLIGPDTLRKWEEALSYVGSIPGLEIHSSGIDASLIDELVANVLRALNRYIEHDVESVMELLYEESSGLCSRNTRHKGHWKDHSCKAHLHKNVSSL